VRLSLVSLCTGKTVLSREGSALNCQRAPQVECELPLNPAGERESSHMSQVLSSETSLKSLFPWWYPVGAQPFESGVAFRVWANRAAKVSVIARNERHALTSENDGYFSGCVEGAAADDWYSFLVDGQGPFPDPASRFQPDGPHGPSLVIDPSVFSWTDRSWTGIRLRGQVIYELHIGTFTREGTWTAAAKQLPQLAELGISAVEVMPVCEFAGSFGWGYDGVDLFAPTRNYGGPDDFRAFVNAAHANGLGVLLDVVYNHLGPDGNYLAQFSPDYFTDRHKTDWGAAINFDGPNCKPVREFFAANAAYWIKEYHLDGLRLDATHSIFDESEEHILALIARKARKAGEPRNALVVAENEPQSVKLIKPVASGGYGLDALWNDDFHHTARVGVTGNRESYYADYLGTPQELLSAFKYGFLYQGQWYSWQKQRRGTSSLNTDCAAMITYLQNHDQLANSARGLRLRETAGYGRYKAITAWWLLGPGTPMFFQGQEFASSAPFLFFADHPPELAELVRKGRAEFLRQWRSVAAAGVLQDDPCTKATFEKCKLDFSERETHAEEFALHRDLLALRKSEPVLARQDRNFDGAVLGPEAFVARFFSEDLCEERLLVVNLGIEQRLRSAPYPLLGPPENAVWTVQWSTEDPRYGGAGAAEMDTDSGWIIPGQAAVLLRPTKKKEGTAADE
jgi:maltooligosyltrehalose trehalohydrolase